MAPSACEMILTEAPFEMADSVPGARGREAIYRIRPRRLTELNASGWLTNSTDYETPYVPTERASAYPPWPSEAVYRAGRPRPVTASCEDVTALGKGITFRPAS